MSNRHLTPLVDFGRKTSYLMFDPTTNAYVAPTSGTVTFYLATTPDALVAADPALSGTALYIGGNGSPPAPDGTWFCGFDAAVLTYALLDSVFLNANQKPIHPYFIVVKPSGSRDVEKLDYKRYKLATVTEEAA